MVDGGNVSSVLCEFAWFCLIYCKNDKTVLAAVARIQISSYNRLLYPIFRHIE